MSIVVMGVSGSGKTTVGRLLADHLGVPFADADDLHPAANVEKMAGGQPLTDADREPWLRAVAQWLAAHPDGVVACSALKRGYRDVLRGAGDVLFAYQHLPHDVLHARLAARRGHFMPASLLDSQLADLEPPGPDERAVTLDGTLAPAQQVEAIIRAASATHR